VKLGIKKSTGEKVAIKILEKSKIKTKPDQARVERELNILKKINHINIIKIIQTKEDTNNIYIIMEFIDYDLFLHIVNNKRLEEKESALFFFN
jgi:serine/threonine protein kinase